MPRQIPAIFKFQSPKCILWDRNETETKQKPDHSDLNDQNLFHSTIDAPPGVPGVSKNPDDQTEVHSGELEG